jgi:uncharacterized RDD family membrane protein YckC
VTLVSPRVRRAQSLLDIGVSVFAAMMVWPFPVARATLSPSVHVAGVIVTCVVVQLAYYAVCAALWRQTLGMRLSGIRLHAADGQPPTRGQGALWGLVSALLAVWFVASPSSAASASTAERLSGTTVY